MGRRGIFLQFFLLVVMRVVVGIVVEAVLRVLTKGLERQNRFSNSR